MPESEGAHIARLEERVQGVRKDLAEVVAEHTRMRKRLHDLEGFAQSYADIQRENRRREDHQYRRLSTAVAVAGVLISIGMLILAGVTLYVHTH